jgi:hypothetical protein
MGRIHLPSGNQKRRLSDPEQRAGLFWRLSLIPILILTRRHFDALN